VQERLVNNFRLLQRTYMKTLFTQLSCAVGALFAADVRKCCVSISFFQKYNPNFFYPFRSFGKH